MYTRDGHFNLRVLASNIPEFLTVQWNSSGHAVEARGFVPPLLDLIAARFRLEYSYVPLGKDISVDDKLNEKGLIGYVRNGEGDLIACGIVCSAERVKHLDFSVPIVESSYGALIPFPSMTVNGNAIAQPFKLEVWALLLVSLVVVICIWVMSSLLLSSTQNKKENERNNEAFIATSYAINVLLNQGGYCPSNSTAVRLTATVWCCAAFVLVPAYSGNLTSYLTSSVEKPVIDSIAEIPGVSGFAVAIDRGKGFDANLQSWASNLNDTLGKLSAKLLTSVFRCNTTESCIEKVIAGRHAYIHGTTIISHIVAEDLKRHNKCHFTVARQPLEKMYLYWGLAKQSPFTSVINLGILEMEANGLLTYHRDKNLSRAPEKCLTSQRPRIKGNKRLKLTQLTSTFLLLSTGFSLAVFSLLIELAIKQFKLHKIIRQVYGQYVH